MQTGVVEPVKEPVAPQGPGPAASITADGAGVASARAALALSATPRQATYGGGKRRRVRTSNSLDQHAVAGQRGCAGDATPSPVRTARTTSGTGHL